MAKPKMKQNILRIIAWLAAAIFVLLGLGWTLRAQLRDTWYGWNRPSIPTAASYRAPERPAPVPAEVAQAVTPGVKPKPTNDPLAFSGELPAEVNLAVPFLLQAPHQNWVQPFEDACEEASLLMVDAFYNGRVSDFAPEEGEKAILDVVAFENEAYGYNKDTDTAEVVHTAQEYFGYSRALVRPLTSPDDMKRVLAQGYPIIVPAYGKGLQNPNFRNGGPEYHMLVVKGYTKDGTWITNDPGTRRGADYLYTNDVLMNAIHSFHEVDMKKGAKEFIVLMPNS